MSGPDDDAHDRVFELLANPRRQLLLRTLTDRGGAVHLRALSRVIAARETERPPEEVGEDAVRRVYISLYQTHVPALVDGGVVEYDDDATVVTLADYPDEVEAILQDWEARRRRWAGYYLLVAYVLAWLAAAAALRFVALPEGVLTTATLVAAAGLVLLSITHHYGARVSQFGGHPFSELTPLEE